MAPVGAPTSTQTFTFGGNNFHTNNINSSMNKSNVQSQGSSALNTDAWLNEMELSEALGLNDDSIPFPMGHQEQREQPKAMMLHDPSLSNIFALTSNQQQQQRQQQQHETLRSPAAVVPDFYAEVADLGVPEGLLDDSKSLNSQQSAVVSSLAQQLQDDSLTSTTENSPMDFGEDGEDDSKSMISLQDQTQQQQDDEGNASDSGSFTSEAIVPSRRSSRASKMRHSRHNRKYSRDTPKYQQRQTRKRNPPINLSALSPSERKRIEEERLEKNRQSARDCRLRKKAYIQGLEEKVEKLSDDLARAEDRENDLVAEVKKLRALLDRRN